MKKILEETLLAIEEKKKCLMKKRPLDPLIEKNIYEWSKVGLTYASNAIEGNTLTEGETAQILEKGIAIGGKTIVEHLEALGHAKAVDLISEIALKKTRQEITVSDVLEIHKVLLEQILPLYAGRFRQSSVRISGSSVARPNALKVPDLMDQLLASLKTSQNSEVLIAADLHLDLDSIATGLLHDTVEDTHATLEDIRREFGEVIATLVVREELTNRNGVMHGGAVMALADNMGGTAAVANLPEGFITSTIESKTNFFAGIALGDTAHAECTPLHRGRTTSVWQTKITRGDGKLAAIVTQTQIVMKKSG